MAVIVQPFNCSFVVLKDLHFSTKVFLYKIFHSINDIEISSNLFWSFIDQLNLFQHHIANGIKIISQINNLRLDQLQPSCKEGAVKYSGLIFTTFSADIEPELPF
jgi:hypothetical protein